MSIDNDLVRESFCQILNENPKIMLSARSGDDFKAFFCEGITPEFLIKVERMRANVDFLNGVILEGVECKKWLTGKSTGSKGVGSRNVISFDFDGKDNPDHSIEKIAEIAARDPNLWLIVHSGHGLHLHFALSSPITLSTDADRSKWGALYSNLKAGIERELGDIVLDKGASVPARTMRLPLSVNFKDPKSPIETKILHFNPDARLNVEGLWDRCLANPLVAPVPRQNDGLREAVLSQLSWEVLFQMAGKSWASAKRTKDGWKVKSAFRDDDDTPSMGLSDNGWFNDLGDLDIKGDKIHFWARHTGLGYGEALRHLAGGAGIVVANTSKRATSNVQIAKAPHNTEDAQEGAAMAAVAIAEPHDEVGEARQKKKKVAQYTDYEALFDSYFGRTERDLLSNELVFRPQWSDRWIPCGSTENIMYFRGLARETDGYYSVAAIEEHIQGRYHMFHHQARREAKFLATIPVWDGVDRIGKIVDCLPLAELDHATVYELFKDWGAKLWERIYNPKIQNRLLLIKGSQGAGKDYLVESMFSALEQYLVQFTVSNAEKELFDVIASGVLMHISEYDRTNRTEVGLLKHIITNSSSTYRKPYARKADTSIMRASFVATSNDNKALRDATGSRRFIYIALKEGESIKRGYPIDSPQILAQCKVLGTQSFRASDESEKQLAKVLSTLQPEDFEDVICEEWEDATIQELDVEVRAEKAKEEMDKIAFRYKVGVNAVRGILKRRGYYKRTAIARLWFKNLTLKDSIEE